MDPDGIPGGRRLYVYPYRAATPGGERLWEERPIGKSSIDPIRNMNEMLKVSHYEDGRARCAPFGAQVTKTR